MPYLGKKCTYPDVIQKHQHRSKSLRSPALPDAVEDRGVVAVARQVFSIHKQGRPELAHQSTQHKNDYSKN